MRRALAIGPLALLAAAWSPLHAQQRPDTGGVLRDLQQPPLPAQPAAPPPVPRVETPERAPLAAPDAARFSVRAFRFSGNTAFSSGALEALLVDLAGKELGLADLQDAAARVTRYYHEHGYPVARAYLPAQDVRDGTVEIAVLEGRYGTISLQNSSRIGDETVRRYLQPLQSGGLVRDDTLERSLLLLSDLPGAATPQAVLRPGSRTGESDLDVALPPAPAAYGSLAVDNFGNRFTGAYRLTGDASLTDPLHAGDLFNARVTTSGSGLDYGRLAYQVPLGGQGLRAGGAYAATRYRIGGQFAPLQASGTAGDAALFAAYPFIRSLGFNLEGQFTADAKRLDDRVAAAGLDTPRHSDTAIASLAGNARNARGLTAFSASFAAGRLGLGSTAAQAADDAGPRTAGSFNKAGYAVSRLQNMAGPASVYLALSGQQASRNLDSSEKFVLGGPYGVRAYPQGEAAGDDAVLLNAELRWRLPGAMPAEALLFFDHGHSRLNHSPFAAGPNTRNLSGYGVGVNASDPSGWVLRASMAWKGGREAATSDTDRGGQGWLLAGKLF